MIWFSVCSTFVSSLQYVLVFLFFLIELNFSFFFFHDVYIYKA